MKPRRGPLEMTLEDELILGLRVLRLAQPGVVYRAHVLSVGQDRRDADLMRQAQEVSRGRWGWLARRGRLEVWGGPITGARDTNWAAASHITYFA
jgi:hypothetical protein